MKNFYEATVIKPALQFDIDILISPQEGHPKCKIELNDQIVFDGILLEQFKTRISSPIGLPLNFKITIDRKHPEAVYIDKIAIDGREVIPLYMNRAIPTTCYLDFSGAWTLNIPNFHIWYHELTGQGWIA
jgi:hypothetical protein